MQLLREEIGNTAGHFSVQQSSRVNSSSPCFVEQSVKHSLEGCGEWTNRKTFRIAVSHCWKPLSPASICRTNRLWLTAPTVLTAHCSQLIWTRDAKNITRSADSSTVPLLPTFLTIAMIYPRTAQQRGLQERWWLWCGVERTTASTWRIPKSHGCSKMLHECACLLQCL